VVVIETRKGNKPFGRLCLGWENNIGKDIKEIIREGVEWIDLAEDSACEHGNEFADSRNAGLSGVPEDLLPFQK
jgi:hypothetical protein